MATLRGRPARRSGPWEAGALRAKAGDRVHEYMRIAPGACGIERMEARFVGQAFSRHQHDSYAIGVTLEGVQTF